MIIIALFSQANLSSRPIRSPSLNKANYNSHLFSQALIRLYDIEDEILLSL